MVAKRSIKTKAHLKTRPPVVCVLGHVDHGKTTLLDYIRKTHVASKESGGITQHIGAYQIGIQGSNLPAGKARSKVQGEEKKITFIDTPGHAAFIALRSRGAKVADLAVLVIDAKEGIKPQTTESIKLIQKGKIPFLVAVNKIDLEGSSVDKVKAQLAEKEILVEDYGGDVVCVPVSAKTGKGIDELLEMIILVSEMQDLKTKTKSSLKAVVIESKMDSQKGPLASLLVKEGHLKTNDMLKAESVYGKAKAMFNSSGKKISQAGPGEPVEILGFKQVPKVGSVVSLAGNLNQRIQKKKHIVKKSNTGKEEGGQKLKLIIKADVNGCLEAIASSLGEETDIIFKGIGNITESDILLAVSTGSIILAFKVKVPKQVQKLADFEGVKIKEYDIIYKLLEDMEEKILKMIEPEIHETVLGKAKVIAEFTMKTIHIAGCKIKEGKISLNDTVHIKREGKLVGNAKVREMQKERINTKQGKIGEEIGIVLTPDIEFQKEDDIISYNE